MQTEQWALFVAVIALLISVGVPVWQSKSNEKRTVATTRTLLLQRILAAKSVTYISMHELIWLLKKYGSKMDDQQRTNLESMVPRMRTHHEELERLHDLWSNFNDGSSLSDIEETLVNVNVTISEADDMAKLIENGRRSNEAT